jgi:TIR domain
MTASGPRSPRFYLSYARADGSLPFVRKLAAEITARLGEPAVFWDEKIRLGAPWWATFERELAKADVLVIAVGPKWKENTGTKMELRMALNGDKPVVPLLIEGASWNHLPSELTSRRGVELTSGNVAEEIRTVVSQLVETFASGTARPLAAQTDVDDPQKGQWGGMSETGDRRLSASIADQGNGWFLVGLTVAHVGGPPLNGEVEFHLHPSFHPSIVRVPVHQGQATLKIPAWGAFTVSVSADEGRTQLELDLSPLTDVPELFRVR